MYSKYCTCNYNVIMAHVLTLLARGQILKNIKMADGDTAQLLRLHDSYSVQFCPGIFADSLTCTLNGMSSK